jgi:hypothetical protein
MKNINAIELKPGFDYYDLDLLRETDISKVLNKGDDELYQLYIKSFIIDFPDAKLSDFYVWIVDNKCYLTESLISKFNRLYKKSNPFKNDIYTLNAYLYLYNKGMTQIYGGSTLDIEYIKKKSSLSINEYRNTR